MFYIPLKQKKKEFFESSTNLRFNYRNIHLNELFTYAIN